MKTKKLIAVILVVLTVVYCGIAALLYDASSGVEMICPADSYAENWAKRHGAEYTLMADTDAAAAQLHLGTFDYDVKNGGCVIVNCNSVSSEIVLPEQIDGYPVVAIEETAFDGCRDLTAVYVPMTVEAFVPLHTEQYVVYCYEDSAVYGQIMLALAEKEAAEALKARAEAAPAAVKEAEMEAERCKADAETAEAEAKAAEGTEEAAELAAIAEEKRALADEAVKKATEMNEEARALAEQLDAIAPEAFVVADTAFLHDSDPINFNTAEIPFSYNQNVDGLELTAYTGKSAQIVVPASIDGVAVTAISFPVEKNVQSVVIPASVTEITAPLVEVRYNVRFFVNVAMVVLGLVIALWATNLSAKRNRTAEQRFLGISLIYSGVKYFVLLLIWAAVALFFGFNLWLQVVIGIVLLAAAPIEVTKVRFAARQVEKTGAEVRKNTLFIRAYRAKAEELEACADAALKAYCVDVAEAFRYSDPVSDSSLLAVEDQIAARFETFAAAVRSGKEQTAKTLAKELLTLIEERNKTCKLLK